AGGTGGRGGPGRHSASGVLLPGGFEGGAQLQGVRPGLGELFAEASRAGGDGGENVGDALLCGGGAAAERAHEQPAVAEDDGLAHGGLQGPGHDAPSSNSGSIPAGTGGGFGTSPAPAR